MKKNKELIKKQIRRIVKQGGDFYRVAAISQNKVNYHIINRYIKKNVNKAMQMNVEEPQLFIQIEKCKNKVKKKKKKYLVFKQQWIYPCVGVDNGVQLDGKIALPTIKAFEPT